VKEIAISEILRFLPQTRDIDGGSGIDRRLNLSAEDASGRQDEQ
jgi:hypothetical protein